MRIGMTYDLRSDYLAEGYTPEETAEFDQERTIAAIETALMRLGHEPERIGHVRKLVGALAAGKRWELVFNIAEGLYGLAREAQVPAILDAYRVPYVFSDAYTLSVCHHKGAAKALVRAAGVKTPDYSVVLEADDIGAVDLPFPLFAKPVAEGTGKGINAASKIRTREELGVVCHRLLREFRQPVLVERFLSGREFTVGITGTGARARTLGVLEIILQDNADPEVYSYDNKEQCANRVTYTLASDAEALVAADTALAAWRALGCRDGGRLDLRSDAAGVPHFMEVNPLAGLNPGHSDLPILCERQGISYEALIGFFMESALERMAGRP
jgi:D-alanine-D-alanine ligase